MANPIIKIKRGTGTPLAWNGITGITAGEFALETDTGVLYMGMSGSGGFSGFFEDAVQSRISSTIKSVIPIGYQISNDSTFGGNSPTTGQFLGYDRYTVPSTHAVREFVKTSVIAAAAGVEFKGGTGIQVIPGGICGTTYTIVNTGVLKGFTSAGVAGNAFGDILYAKSAIDGITFIGGGGIALRSSNANGSLLIQNIGVTSIGGFTGTINTFSPIVSLSGFTAGIGFAIRDAITVQSPIVKNNIDTPGSTGIEISHANSVTADSHLAYSTANPSVPQLLNIKFNSSGHIIEYSTEALDFRTGLPDNFAQAVQDAAYPGITNFYGPNNYGIDYVYDDGTNRLRTINRGITSLGVAVGAVGSAGGGLSGAVKLAAGVGSGGFAQLSVAQDKNNNTITYEYSGVQYKSFQVKDVSATPYLGNGGIYLGGIKGANSAILTAASAIANLNVVPGRGIGVSMGTMNGEQTMLLWNAGVNRISAYNSGSVLLGGTGFSGNIDLVAGTNVVFSRGSGSTDNTLTISSTGGGGGGAVSWLQGDYTTETNPAEDFDGAYTSDGVTGAISISGLNGILTIQDSGNNGSPSTKNGSLFIGLGSNVYIRPKILDTPTYPNVGSFNSEIVIATARETAEPEFPNTGYATLLENYSRLVTDVVEGGLTAAFTYGGNDAFSPTLPGNFDYSTSKPGNILSLRAKEGIFDLTGGAGSPSPTGKYAELRLLGYPNPENMSAYIQDVYDHATAILTSTGCAGSNCIGYPSILPSCNAGLIDNSPAWYFTDGLGNRVLPTGSIPDSETWNGQLVGTSVFHSNVVARDSIFVQKDIWLTGDLIDATTGCLYGVSGGSSTSVFNRGNLGLTGDLVVGGSIYVHGGTAFFNVADLSVESPLIKLGGISASTGYSDAMVATASGSARDSDRGLLLYSYHAIPYGALHNRTAAGAAAVTDFIGIDSSTGTFKYVIASGGVSILNNVTTINGILGPANFSEINSVGITSDGAGTISLKAGGGSTPALITDAQFYGAATIIGNANTRGTITLGANAKLQVGNIADVGITFNRSIEFNAGSSDGAANALKIRYQGTGDASAVRNISIRTPATNNYTQLVDVGRSPAADSNYAGGNDLGQQTIYNKTLADGTIIDCGTY